VAATRPAGGRARRRQGRPVKAHVGARHGHAAAGAGRALLRRQRVATPPQACIFLRRAHPQPHLLRVLLDLGRGGPRDGDRVGGPRVAAVLARLLLLDGRISGGRVAAAAGAALCGRRRAVGGRGARGRCRRGSGGRALSAQQALRQRRDDRGHAAASARGGRRRGRIPRRARAGAHGPHRGGVVRRGGVRRSAARRGLARRSRRCRGGRAGGRRGRRQRAA
jgi:hypothetical protein